MKRIQTFCLGALGLILLAANADAGRWLTRDPLEHMERDPQPTVDQQQINLYQFVLNNPINRIDPLGLWSPGAHDVILRMSFSKRLTPDQIAVLQRSSRFFDEHTQSTEESHKHSMRVKKQTPNQAIKCRDDFIEERIKFARIQYYYSEDLDLALSTLAEALHTAMDSTSAMHVDAKGNPQLWRGLLRDGPGHSPNDHIGNERISDLTFPIIQQNQKLLNDILDRFFAK